jgi:putative aldouronate transport system substrate-binding protein
VRSVLVLLVLLVSFSVAQEGTLRIAAGVVGGKTPEEMDLFEQELAGHLGLESVEMVKPSADYDQFIQTALRGGEQFDLIYMTSPLMNILVEQQALVPLTDFIESSSILSDSSVIPTEEWEQLRYPDGQIYAVFNKFEGGTMPTIRADWLEKLGLEVPTTLDEYYTVLKAFVEQDPDGNGENDTYGLSSAGLYDLQPFFGAYGVKARYVITDGKRTIPYATEAAIPAFEWLNRLYEEGVFDPNFVTNDTAAMRNLFLADGVGMVTYWDAWVGLFNSTRLNDDPETDFRATGIAAPEGANGERVMRRGDPSVWAIPANAANPDAARRFLEFWHTEPGIILGSVGVKDVDYVVTDGTLELTDIGREHNLDHGVPRWYNTNVEPPFGTLPGVAEAQEIVMQYSTLETSLPEWSQAEAIVNDYAFRAITGEMAAAEAVTQMNQELLAAGLIDE